MQFGIFKERYLHEASTTETMLTDFGKLIDLVKGRRSLRTEYLDIAHPSMISEGNNVTAEYCQELLRNVKSIEKDTILLVQEFVAALEVINHTEKLTEVFSCSVLKLEL